MLFRSKRTLAAALAAALLFSKSEPAAAQAAALPFVRAVGPHLIDDRGDTLVFRGLSIADPDRIEREGRWSRAHFELAKGWGAQLVRIPVHPRAWRERGEAAYLALLDEAIRWCGELGMYAIIDWHSIGNLEMELFQHPMYDTSKKETFNFWLTIARRYRDEPVVAFFELFNEPTTYMGQLGACPWPEWKATLEKTIDLVRANGARAIPLVAGLNWAYDLREAAFQPVAREGIAYVAHPYPGKNRPPREPDWEAHFGFLADRCPVVATEIGFTFDEKGDVPLPDDGIYTKTILPYLEKKGISWCAWVFDPSWDPPMLKNWDGEPTVEGAFWREALLKK